MRGITKLSVLSLSLFVLSGCWLDDDNDNTSSVTPPEPEPQSSYLRIHHTSADAPNVNVLADGSALLENVPYQASSDILEVDAASYSVTVQGILPDDTTVDAIGPVDLDLEADTRYDVFAIGNVGDESLEPLVIANPVSEVASGESRLQVVHAAYDAPTVDVYLTAPDEELASASAAATLEYGDYTGQIDVNAGDYRVRLTPAGETTVVYDSGTLPLADGGDYVVSATDDVETAGSPVALQIATGVGADTLLVPSADAGSDLRVIHAAADAPAVNVTLNEAAEPQVSELAFTEFTPYLNVPAGDYSVDVAVAADGTNVLSGELALENSTSYSVYAVGAVEDGSLGLQVLTENRRTIATAAQLQIVHAAPSAGEVDIYLTETDDISNADPVLTGIPFVVDELVTTGNVQVFPGQYFATVTAAGTKEAAIGPVELTLTDSGLYTIVAVDADGSGLPPQVILLDDFVAE
ncbi:DUF4397 domain-containing protein [Idiomarina seosinensis]|uniref:DUF4397 domain-containing protein n=1 Tax=Idiomarina seosinensis TaxID=281739 RepID=A0A432ZDR4_9GAMM|nr:DUF4397 domain-containing protein [Idiomarina seosinensis]RUO76034.1 hypothetical protein CWI81_07905 [Idiomarina seosinensis]